MTGSTYILATFLAQTAPASNSCEPEARQVANCLNGLVDNPEPTCAKGALPKTMLDLLSVWEAAKDEPHSASSPLERERAMMSELGLSQADLLRAGVFPTEPWLRMACFPTI